MFAWQDCSKLFTSCSELVLLQNCSKLVDNKLLLTSWLLGLQNCTCYYSKIFEQLGKGLLKQTTSCLLEQVAEKLRSSELLCMQIRSNKLCSVSGLTNLQHFLIVYGVVYQQDQRHKILSKSRQDCQRQEFSYDNLICLKWTKSHTIGCCYWSANGWLWRQQDKRNYNGTNILYFEMRFSFEVWRGKFRKKNMVSFSFATN